jgi:hypothetical protein
MDIGYFVERNKGALIAGAAAGAALFYSIGGCDNLMNPPEPHYDLTGGVDLTEGALRQVSLGVQVGWSVLAGTGAAVVYKVGERIAKRIGERFGKRESEERDEINDYDHCDFTDF